MSRPDCTTITAAIMGAVVGLLLAMLWPMF